MWLTSSETTYDFSDSHLDIQCLSRAGLEKAQEGRGVIK